MFQLRPPRTEEDFERYYDLRWRILREPWGQPRGSERDSFDESGIHVMALDDKNVMLGAGCLHFNHPTEAQIRYMAVEAASQRLGVGRAMVEWLEHHAGQRGAISIVLNSRESAVGFYARLGYSIFETGETMFGHIKHFRMRKQLTGVGQQLLD